jgi:hypothetical protein
MTTPTPDQIREFAQFIEPYIDKVCAIPLDLPKMTFWFGTVLYLVDRKGVRLNYQTKTQQSVKLENLLKI